VDFNCVQRCQNFVTAVAIGCDPMASLMTLYYLCISFIHGPNKELLHEFLSYKRDT
jgi:hypothetical protein